MNLFTISDNTKHCIQSLDDVLLRKTIVESAQMLSTAVHLNDEIIDKPECLYKVYNANEEHNAWVRESKYNYKWTFYYLMDGLMEYRYRFDKNHDSWRVAQVFSQYEDLFPNIGMTPFPRKFNKEYENYNELMNMKDTFKAYKLYLITKWKKETADNKTPIWTRRDKPDFYE